MVAVVCLVASQDGAALAQLKPQQELGSRFRTRPTPIDPIKAGAMRKGYARCMVNGQPSLIGRILSHSDPVTIDWHGAGEDQRKLYESGRMRDCLGRESNPNQMMVGMSATDGSLRAMLMEEAYLKAFAAPPLVPEGQLEILPRSYVSADVKLAEAQSLATFADCVAYRDTVHADALLRTAPETDAARDAARALAPTLGACLVQGQTITFTAKSIRAIAADGLWTRFVQRPGALNVTMK